MTHSMKPFFSIGVTTYNRHEMLRENLQSILDQDFEDFEIVVCNDLVEHHVDEETIGVADRRLQFFNNRERVGPLANHNLVLSYCRGRYFTWLADDDLFSEGTLQAVFNALKKHAYPKCVYTAYRADKHFDDLSCPTSGESGTLTGVEFVRLYLERTVAVIGNYGFFEIDWLKSVEGMKKLGNGEFSPYSDNLLAVSTLKLARVIFIDRELILYRLHDGSPSYASKQLEVFRTAQADFLASAQALFVEERLKEDTTVYFIRKILEWCQGDIRTVAYRSGETQFLELFKHVQLVWVYYRFVNGASLKPRMALISWFIKTWIGTLKRYVRTLLPRMISFVRSF